MQYQVNHSLTITHSPSGIPVFMNMTCANKDPLARRCSDTGMVRSRLAKVELLLLGEEEGEEEGEESPLASQTIATLGSVHDYINKQAIIYRQW